MNIRLALGMAALAAVATSAQAAVTIASFVPEPNSSDVPELLFSTALSSGSGAIGNGDGEFPATMTAGGLTVTTPFGIAVPGSLSGIQGTTIYDATLRHSGLSAGAAFSFSGYSVQALGSGTFTLLSTDPVGPVGSVVLLEGTISSATIGGPEGSNQAGVQATTVTYTGGLIYDALVGLAGQGANVGGLSYSLTLINGVYTNSGSVVAPFQANATGSFSVPFIPEPATASLMLVAGGLALARRRA